MAVRIQDGAGNTLTSTASALDINIKSSSGSQTVSGTVAVSNFPATQPVSGTVAVSNFPATQPVSASALPLPSGASTAAKQPALGTAGTPSADVISVQGVAGGVAQPVSGTVAVSNFPATQPVSGTVTSNIGTTNGLALDATLTSGTQKSKLVDTGGTNVASVSAAGALKVDGSAVTQPVSGTFFQATQPVSGTVAVSNFPATQAISAAALPLPAGASTAAKQPAIGTAGTPSADVITVQGAASMTALKVDGSAVTQPVSGSVSVSNFPATQPVSGTVTANIGTSGSLALDASVTGLEVAQGSTTSGQKGFLTQAAVVAITPTYTPGQTSPITITAAGALRVDASATTQPISGTILVSGNVTVVQPTGTNLHAVVDSGTVTAVTAITNALPTGANTLGSVKLTDGTTVPGVIAGTTSLKTDASSVAGTATAVSAAGVQKVGIVGNAGAAVDTTISSGAAPANVVYTTQAPTSVAAGAYTVKFQNASGAAVSVKASAGNLYGFSITNETAAVAYIEFFNIATTPVLGTTAVVFAVKLPASANITISPGAIALQNFTAGIGFAVTTTENGATAVSVTGMIFYQ